MNEGTIQSIIRAVGSTCVGARTRYVNVQDDIPEGWSLSSTLGMFGLGAISPVKPATPVIDPETAKEMFSKLYALSNLREMLTDIGLVPALKQLCC